MTSKLISFPRAPFGFALLLILVFLIYSNTFRASWHLDDYSSILYNTRLHINDFQPTSLLRTVFIHDGQGESLSRPVTHLPLAANWYFGKANVFGYHVVNVLIHFLTACFLFLTVYNILRLPNLRNIYRGKEYFIALLASTLWAINPIQTQAVTYIVQRMASLSTMFYVLSVFFYIKGRTAHAKSRKYSLFLCCFLSFFLALGSKEIAATLPMSLFLIEICFFQDLGEPGIRKAFVWSFFAGILLLAGIGTIFMGGSPLS